MFVERVSAGFPSPASDYEEDRLDLNRYLVRNPAATFFVRVSGDSMLGAGIHEGDILVIDRSLEPRDKSIVIANIDGELTVKRMRIRGKKVTLEAENEKYEPTAPAGESSLEIWGVVTNVIHPV